MIEADYWLARHVLQILTEERHGHLMREAKAIEDAQVAKASRELGRKRPD